MWLKYHELLDALLSYEPTNVVLPTNTNRRRLRNNRAYEKQVNDHIVFFQTIMDNQKLLFHEVWTSKFAFITVPLPDLMNGLFYVFVFLVLPVLNREKSEKLVTGNVGKYHSFQFPDCFPLAEAYFEKYQQSTLNGLKYIHQYFVSTEVSTIEALLRDVLDKWDRFTNEQEYIVLDLPPEAERCNRPLEFFEALHGNQGGNQGVVYEAIVSLMNTVLAQSFAKLGITRKVLLRNRQIWVPNIWNKRIVLQKNNNSNSNLFGKIIFYVLYLLSFISNKCATVLQKSKEVNNMVRRFRFDIMSPEEFLRTYFGFTYTTRSQNGKLNLTMTLLYVKLVVSLLRVKRQGLTIKHVTNDLCAFYHRFTLDRNDFQSVKQVKYFIQILSPYFYLFQPTLSRVSNQVQFHRFDPNMLSIVSVYTSVIQILTVIRSGAVSPTSGFLESTRRANVVLQKDPVLQNMLIQWVYLKNVHNTRGATQLTREIKDRVLRVHLQIHPKLFGVFAPVTQRVIAPVARRVVLPMAKKVMNVTRPIAQVLY